MPYWVRVIVAVLGLFSVCFLNWLFSTVNANSGLVFLFMLSSLITILGVVSITVSENKKNLEEHEAHD